VLPKYRTAIYVHGCFWHRHAGCSLAYTPKSNLEFWEKKFTRNIERDAEVATALKEAGWKQVVVWECETKDLVVLARRLKRSL
jgi:DNA mismatch endonuclease (patch repair protein)